MATYKKLHIGEPAPPFRAQSTGGMVNFPDDFIGRWVLFFMYIGDFMPTCATEVLALDQNVPRLEAHNTAALALSADSIADHLVWIFSLRNINNGAGLNYDLVSDRTLEISKNYGVNNVSNDLGKIEKAVFIIDSNGIIQAIHTYSHSVGVNFTELEREILALQTARYQYGMTPAGWTPGEDILDYPPRTVDSACSNMAEKEAMGGRCVDWYICYRQDTGLRKPRSLAPLLEVAQTEHEHQQNMTDDAEQVK